LANLHFTDQILNESWLEINKNKIWKYKYFDKPIPKWITRARSLHDRMKDFFKVYFNFLTNDVIELNWSAFANEFNNLNEFEEINLNLQKFLNTVLKNSILTNEKLIKIFSRSIHIINAYSGFLLSLRKVLILLNFDLFEKYSDRLRGQFYDYNKNLERLEKLNSYLNEYLDSFNQHLIGLIEGLKYYGELETPEFLILAERLQQSFPNASV
jgi:gamma-tubulin complex component 2